MSTLVNSAFMRFTRRAEVVDRSQLLETFVDAGPLMALLRSLDHQVIYGRRGTGKTHALSYLVEDRSRNGEATVYVDLRTIGSSGGIYADPNIPLSERATRLLLDTLAAIHDRLMDYSLAEDLNLSQLGPILDSLADAITEVTVVGTIQQEREAASELEVSASDKAELTASASGPTFSIEAANSNRSSSSDRLRVAETGVARHRVHFGKVGAVLIKLKEALDRHIWVVLDEWSSIPLDLQPYLADLLRRTILPAPGYTIKLGAIEQRSKMRLPTDDGDYIGLELGADVAADINLDDFMVFENDQSRAKDFFRELLYRHFRAVVENPKPADYPKTASQLIRTAFTQSTAFDEYIRASEGVPRDAINIISLSAQRALNDPISVQHVRVAAHSWYQRDKEAAVSSNSSAHALLHWIIDQVIGDRRARAFLLRRDVSHPLIDSLFDSRVLHVLKKSVSAHDEPGVRYDVYKLDYGCYVDMINTARAPQGLFQLDNKEVADPRFIEVPPDDYRSIRRAILDINRFDRVNRGRPKNA